ncbi:hypothetical protein DPMN_004243 [Dreissena polymorpha]|uniref:Uncharacterized protein n=2 Tax=Dreissena polymorpha TaxID=45954 RepID=A0A9D4MQH3_DREPO|nr:hypothetical protein DPMN_004243 [Dreissena polymorpha]
MSTIIISSCSVSPKGDMIYVTNCDRHQLVTLSRDGTVISTLTDPAWSESLSRIHVTDSGQVLVCGGASSDTIIQLDRNGRRKLAEVVTKKDGVSVPISVFYRKCTGTLIVGMLNNDDIMVFQTE